MHVTLRILNLKSNIVQAFYVSNPGIKSVSGYGGGMFIHSGPKWWKRGTEYATPADAAHNNTFLKFRAIEIDANRTKLDKVTLYR